MKKVDFKPSALMIIISVQDTKLNVTLSPISASASRNE